MVNFPARPQRGWLLIPLKTGFRKVVPELPVLVKGALKQNRKTIL